MNAFGSPRDGLFNSKSERTDVMKGYPQRLKPRVKRFLTAWLKPCPFKTGSANSCARGCVYN
jgi:hypothetical protein